MEPDRLHKPDRLLKPARSGSQNSISPLKSQSISQIAFTLATLLVVAGAACTGASEATAIPIDTLVPTATDLRETQVPTEIPILQPTATTAPTESEEFISPYTPSAPTGSGAILDPVELRLNFENGAVYRFRILTTQDLSQTFEGQTFDIGQEIGFEYTYTVTSVESDGSAWIDVAYTRAIYEVDTPFGTDTYDSADPPAQTPEGAQGFAAIVGSGFLMRIGPDGEVLEIEGLGEMYEQMLGSLDIQDPELRQLLEVTLQEQYSEQSLTDQVGSLLFDFPEGALRVGDTWASTQETNVMLPVVTENIFTLVDFDENTALIEVKSEISTGAQEGGMDFGLFAFDMKLSGSQDGQIRVDLNTGLANSVIDQVLSGEMTIVVEGEEIAVPISILQTIQVESVQISP